MISLLLFLFPAGFALKFKDDIFAEEMKNKDYVLTFMKYTFIINLIMFIILYLYNVNKEFILSVSLENIEFIIKYMIIAFALAIIVPVVDEFLRKFISFKINFRKVSEKDEKKNSK